MSSCIYLKSLREGCRLSSGSSIFDSSLKNPVREMNLPDKELNYAVQQCFRCINTCIYIYTIRLYVMPLSFLPSFSEDKFLKGRTCHRSKFFIQRADPILGGLVMQGS